MSAFVFGPFRLDPVRKRLFHHTEPVAIGAHHLAVLAALVAQAGQTLTKDQLIAAGWGDVAVAENSLERAVSILRRIVGASAIETQPRRGYRFVGEVTRGRVVETDATIDALLAPHRAWIEGRAALETLEGTGIQHAREVFARVLAAVPDQAAAHVGLANACILQYELTRADARPDRLAIDEAAAHAREACRLEPGYGEAWATLGFVLERAGGAHDARAALRRAVMLEPDNWRHQLRLSYGSWGEERLRAARRTLSLLPGFPMAHWLAATVHVARQALVEAERELTAGLASPSQQAATSTRFGAVGLHWLMGLLHLSRDRDDIALAAFGRELVGERPDLLYSRECCANVHYAIGALHLRRGRRPEAARAFQLALERAPRHALARLGLEWSNGDWDRALHDRVVADAAPADVDLALYQAAALSLAGRPERAAKTMAAALDAAPTTAAGWLLPVEPLVHVSAVADVWADALARLRTRAA